MSCAYKVFPSPCSKILYPFMCLQSGEPLPRLHALTVNYDIYSTVPAHGSQSKVTVGTVQTTMLGDWLIKAQELHQPIH